jgi:hypothetical protein
LQASTAEAQAGVGSIKARNPERSLSFHRVAAFASIAHVCRDLRVRWLRMIWLGISEFLGFLIVAILFAYCVHNAPYLTAPHSLGNISVNLLGYGIPALAGWHVAKRSQCESHRLRRFLFNLNSFYDKTS